VRAFFEDPHNRHVIFQTRNNRVLTNTAQRDCNVGSPLWSPASRRSSVLLSPAAVPLLLDGGGELVVLVDRHADALDFGIDDLVVVPFVPHPPFELGRGPFALMI
jgi:hypothetical protein